MKKSLLIILSFCLFPFLPAQAEVIPLIVNYKTQGNSYTGPVLAKFAIIEPGVPNLPLWTNDGTMDPMGEPINFVSVSVNDGVLHANLGDTASMKLLPAKLLDGVLNPLVRIWIDNGSQSVELPPVSLPGDGHAFASYEAKQWDPAATDKLVFWDGIQLTEADMQVKSSGNSTSLAIGGSGLSETTFPLELIAGSGRGVVEMSRAGFEAWQLWITTTGQRGLEVRTASNNNDVVYLAENGNVGVGTQNPAGKLDVSGTIGIQGNPVISASTVWLGDPAPLKGPVGDKGLKGDSGNPGAVGLKGVQGNKGPMGDPGVVLPTVNSICATAPYTSCRNVCSGQLLESANAPCSLQSDTGTCSNQTSPGSCCVCKP